MCVCEVYVCEVCVCVSESMSTCVCSCMCCTVTVLQTHACFRLSGRCLDVSLNFNFLVSWVTNVNSKTNSCTD